MKAMHWIALGALAVGGYLVWKNRAKLMAAISPDPTVQTLAGSTYGGAQDVNGNIAAAALGLATAAFGSSGGAGNSTTPTAPSDNAALSGADGGSGFSDYTDYAGMLA